MTAEQLDALLERLTVAQTVIDVNIAAGIALNELRGVDDWPPHQPKPSRGTAPKDAVSLCLQPGLLLRCQQKIALPPRS